MPQTDFYLLLSTSMKLLRAEAPKTYYKLGALLQNLKGRVSTEEGTRIISFKGCEFGQIEQKDCAVDVEVAFASRVVLDLVDGHVTLEEAILDESIWVRGDAIHVERYYEALKVFVGGAIRLPEFLLLLDQYRASLSTRYAQTNREIN